MEGTLGVVCISFGPFSIILVPLLVDDDLGDVGALPDVDPAVDAGLLQAEAEQVDVPARVQAGVVVQGEGALGGLGAETGRNA